MSIVARQPQSDNTTLWAESDAGIRIKNIKLSIESDAGSRGMVGLTIKIVDSIFTHPSQLRKFQEILLPSHFPAKREPIQNYNKEDLCLC